MSCGRLHLSLTTGLLSLLRPSNESSLIRYTYFNGSGDCPKAHLLKWVVPAADTSASTVSSIAAKYERTLQTSPQTPPRLRVCMGKARIKFVSRDEPDSGFLGHAVDGRSDGSVTQDEERASG